MIKARYPVSLALTHRGNKAAVTTLVLISIGAMLRDVIILSVSIILVGLIIVQYLRLRTVLGNLEKNLILSPSEVSESLVAGDEYRTQIHLESKMGFVYELSSSIESLFFRQEGPGKTNLELVFTPLLSGKYVDTSIHFVTRDGFDLVRGERNLPFTLKFKVYPRVFPVALQAVNFLYESGASDTGSSPRQFRGRGLEYSESRDYVPGDPLNVVDWKATARLARPIVKEYLVEGGGGVGVLFDSTASDPVSLDIVSSEFLRAALSLAYSQVPFEILTLDNGLIVAEESTRSSFGSVEKALMMALSGKLTDFYECYSLLEPEKSRYSKDVFRKITRRSLDSSVGLPIKYRGRFRTEQSLIIFSSLSGDPVPLLESKEDNWLQVTVLQPTRPWLWASSLTESIRIRVHHDRMVRVFERSGVKVVSDLQEAVDASYANVEVPVIAK